MKNRNILIFLLISALTLAATSLSAKEAIRFVYYADYAPFGWEENGEMKGIYVDIVNEVFTNHLGIEVVHQGYPWKRAQMMVKSDKADGYCTVVTPERLTYSTATKNPIIEVNFKIFASAQNSKLNQLKNVRSISGLQGFLLVDYLGSGWAEQHLAEAGLRIHWLPTNEQIWNYLLAGRADATVKNEWTARYFLKKHGYQDKIVEIVQPMNDIPTNFHILIGNKSPFHKYLPQIDNILEQLRKTGSLQKIYNKYK